MKISPKLLKQWIATKQALDLAKAQEMDLRTKLCAAVTDGCDLPGTYHCQTAAGKLTATLSNNFKLDEAVLEVIKPKLTPPEIECIQVKHALILKSFKQLKPNCILNRAVVETPAAPTLKLKEDK